MAACCVFASSTLTSDPSSAGSSTWGVLPSCDLPGPSCDHPDLFEVQPDAYGLRSSLDDILAAVIQLLHMCECVKSCARKRHILLRVYSYFCVRRLWE